jgi:hypothetical protein
VEQPPENSSEPVPTVRVLTIGDEPPDIEVVASLMNDLRGRRHLQLILQPRGMPTPKSDWSRTARTTILSVLRALCMQTESVEGRLSRRTIPARPPKRILEVILRTTPASHQPSTNGAIGKASPNVPASV